MKSNTFEAEIQHKIDLKTKPLGSLGQLETLAKQIAKVQNTLTPKLSNPTILVFAADHGIAHSGVSAYPASVTAQMVLNFLNGGAAINVFSRQNGIDLKIIDAGVDYEFEPNENLINCKIRRGTNNFLHGNAMSIEEVESCFNHAKTIVDEVYSSESNIIGFGEMGIGNSSSASLLMSYVCEIPIEDCVGRGTGLTDEQLKHKIQILKQAQANHPQPENIKQAIAQLGGFEIAQICGAMLRSYEHNMLTMVDGFIITSAFLCAYAINPKIIDNAIFCHQSNEQRHQKMLNFLNADALVNLNLRLGEGTGCAIAYPIIQSALAFLNEMASFESAGISNKDEL